MILGTITIRNTEVIRKYFITLILSYHYQQRPIFIISTTANFPPNSNLFDLLLSYKINNKPKTMFSVPYSPSLPLLHFITFPIKFFKLLFIHSRTYGPNVNCTRCFVKVCNRYMLSLYHWGSILYSSITQLF
jgi:hypothetical protein